LWFYVSIHAEAAMAPHRDVGGVLKRHGYIEVRKIGEGSFGKAILVTSEDAKELVCKMVDVSQASQKETQDAVKEGRLLAQFKHPYVVRYRESFIDSGWMCILMDYCDGGDLSAQIQQAKRSRRSIPEEKVMRWMTQALLALKYLHEKHVLHRDLKSGNFFLSKSGNLKMGDFGIAKVLSCTAAVCRTQIGTPYYLSPEVCQEKPYGWPSDIWAMGCILFELCALRVPFDAPNISRLVEKICRGPTPSIQGYPEFLRQLGTEMLSRNQHHRPTAESILQRPPMQRMVKQLLDEAKKTQESKDSEGTAAFDGLDAPFDARPDKAIILDPVLAPMQAPSVLETPSSYGGGAPGPYAGAAGTYRKGDMVEYHSNTHKDWLPAVVLDVDKEGRIVIDLKPKTYLSREIQARMVRPRRRSAPPAPVPEPARPRPVATPMRHRSPSVGAIQREGTPSRRFGEGGAGGGGRPVRSPGRAPSPGPRVYSKSPSLPGIPGAQGYTPSYPSTPGRAASPGPAGPPGAQRHNDAGGRQIEMPQGLHRHGDFDRMPGGLPGLPRPPGAPRVPVSFRNAGFAIAGM